jgi:putative membrane protein
MNRLPLAFSLALLLGVSGALPTVLPAADTAATATPSVNQDDADFVHEALLGSQEAIKTSELAGKRGLVGAELTFAQAVASEHGAMHSQLKTLAGSKQITIPAALDEAVQKRLDALGKENDKDFAETYLETQIKAHKRAVSTFQEASEDAKDADVKAFAIKHLAKLQAHLAQAKDLESKH